MDDDHHQGLEHNLETLSALARERRRLLQWAGVGIFSVVGCSAELDTETESASGGASFGGSGPGTCSAIPEETAGPYPGDGTNGENALTLSGIVRSDIRPSLSSDSVAEGIPLTVKLRVVDSGECATLAGYVVYLWHCDREGNYSMYSEAVASETYLRGVQEVDADGVVTFTTIFPACYSGRWPHIHFEVYPSLAEATSGDNAIATSQLALPESVCSVVFETEGYEASISNLDDISLDSDNVFSDGADLQLADVSGNVEDGYVAMLTVAI